MRSIEQSIKVNFRFPVHFTTGLFDPGNSLLAQTIRSAAKDDGAKMLFAIDANVVKHHPKLLNSIQNYFNSYGVNLDGAPPTVILPGGEAVKNDPKHLAAMYDAINTAKICRHSFVIAIGGGALLDMAGYAAATAHRGVRLIRVPTTVLAQNDSGVGVKNGINLYGKKNFVGAFAPPFAVLNDFDFLTTLEQRDWLAGISEAIKVGLIRDKRFFEAIQQQADLLVKRDMPAMQQLIHRCAELHLAHIANSGDPFESGSSRPLDFGHWAAHKLEQMTDFHLRHGEAVAIGIALDVMYSALMGFLPADERDAILRCIQSVNLPLHDEAMTDSRTLLKGLEEFREHLGGRLTITMLKHIGEGFEVHEIDQNKMRMAIDELAAFAAATA